MILSTNSKGLKEIIDDDEKRRKLVIYINPPYAEAGNRKVIADGGLKERQKTDVAVKHKVYKEYLPAIGIAGRELFAQFFARIYFEIPNSVLAEFSKLKILQAPNFKDFRSVFQARLGGSFIVPADTFDNVNGKFPIGFFIWHLDDKQIFTNTISDIYDRDGNQMGTKGLYALDGSKSINDWIIATRNQPKEEKIGYMSCRSHDFSNVNYNFIMNCKEQMKSPRGSWVTDKNLREVAIYLAVCHCIEPTWLNDRDQFLYPDDSWQYDMEFQNDCLAYTLFSNFNNIQRRYGKNFWIPFTEEEVDAKDRFKSHFMADYISGKSRPRNDKADIFSQTAGCDTGGRLRFSTEAQAVMDAGRQLWRYYHAQPEADPDASFYDIRLYFQGVKVTKSGKEQMNSSSSDARYTALLADLRAAIKTLACKIESKVYQYGFLKR